MDGLQRALDSVVCELSDQNYEQSLAFYRFWFNIGQTYHQIPPGLIFDTILENRGINWTYHARGEIFHPTAHLILRFASDAESDPIFAPYNFRLQSRLCARILQEFFNSNLEAVWQGKYGNKWSLWADANLIARWANLGYVEKTAIRNHILQSLISHPKLYNHQADALIILFKLAGATFEAHADPSVVDRCFDLLKDHYNGNSVEGKLVQVRAPCVVKCDHWAKTVFQEVVALREHGWEDPPPSITQSPSTSIATLSNTTIADNSDDKSTIDPMTAAPHETFYVKTLKIGEDCWIGLEKDSEN
jgi:hypothetical protein